MADSHQDSGRGAAEDTFPKLLRMHARVRGRRPAFRHKDRGIWQTWTWVEVHDKVRAIALGLKKLGVGEGDKVAIVGANRPPRYWTLCAAPVLPLARMIRSHWLR